LAINDIYPSEVQLDKGDYIIRLNIRHDDPTLLETLRNLPIVLDRKIDPGIALPIRAMAGHAVKLGTTDLTGKERTLVPGERKALFIGPLADETKLPKDAAPGRVLAGKLSVGLKSAGNGDAPGAAVLTYIVPPKKVESAPSPGADGAGATDAEDKKEKKSSEDLLKEAVRDAEVKFLKGMKTESAEERVAYEKLLQELNGRWPGHLPILQEPVKRLTARKQGLTKETDERDVQELLPRIVAAADAVLSAIDTTELAVYVARKTPEEGAGAAARKKEMDEKKAAVIEALAAKCSALMDLQDGVVPCANTAAPSVASSASPEEASEPQSNPPPSKSSDEIEAAYEELRKWIDLVSDPAHAGLASRREERAGRLAGALKAMEKSLKPEDGPPKKSVLERRIKLLKQLGWDHWVNVEEARLQKAFPPGWPPL
jgi:tripeptidyl-peptidase II